MKLLIHILVLSVVFVLSNVATGQQLTTVIQQVHLDEFGHVWIIPHSDFLLVSSQNTLYLINYRTQKLVRTASGHKDFIQDIIVTKDGKQAFTAGADGKVIIWSLPSFTIQHVVQTAARAPVSLSYNEDEKRLAAVFPLKEEGDVDHLCIFSTEDLKILTDVAFKGYSFTTLKYSIGPAPVIYLGTLKGEILKYDERTHTIAKKWTSPFANVIAFIASADGKVTAICDRLAGPNCKNKGKIYELTADGKNWAPKGENPVMAAYLPFITHAPDMGTVLKLIEKDTGYSNYHRNACNPAKGALAMGVSIYDNEYDVDIDRDIFVELQPSERKVVLRNFSTGIELGEITNYLMPVQDIRVNTHWVFEQFARFSDNSPTETWDLSTGQLASSGILRGDFRSIMPADTGCLYSPANEKYTGNGKYAYGFRGLINYDPATGTKTEVVKTNLIPPYALSPDEKHVAFDRGIVQLHQEGYDYELPYNKTTMSVNFHSFKWKNNTLVYSVQDSLYNINGAYSKIIRLVAHDLVARQSAVLWKVSGQPENLYDCLFLAGDKIAIFYLDAGKYSNSANWIVYDVGTARVLAQKRIELIKGTYQRKNGNIVYASRDSIIQLDPLTQKCTLLFRYPGLNRLTMTADEKYYVIVHEEGYIDLVDVQTQKLTASLISLFDKDHFESMVVTPDGYYLSTRNGVKAVGYRVGNDCYGAEQFDLFYNRPDIVLGRMGYGSTALINAYHNAWLRRLKKSKVTDGEASNIDLSKYPEVADAHWQVSADKTKLSLSCTLRSKDATLKSYTVWVNDVPCILNPEQALPEAANTYQLHADIPLCAGDNKVQVGCSSSAGISSPRASYMTKGANSHKERTIFIGIGAEKYRDSAMNLHYAAKDIHDLALAFTQKFPGADTITLYNDKVTVANILAMKARLMNTNVEDRVIIAFSGHGLQDDSSNFYCATYDVNFPHPQTNGLAYEALEGLLDSIPARKKLLLIDACHSGEVDNDGTATAMAISPADGRLKAYKPGTRGGEVTNTSSAAGSQAGLELRRKLFADFSQSSGAVVISAAGGMEYALEDGKYGNGVFTYCIKQAIAEKNSMTVTELNDYVCQHVLIITGGAQKPNARRENLEWDWKVW